MTTRIELRLLRKQLDRVLTAVEQRHGPVIQVDADDYWLIESPEKFDLRKDAEHSVGTLTDDAEELAGMAERSADELIPWHDLNHLVGLLEALAAHDRAS